MGELNSYREIDSKDLFKVLEWSLISQEINNYLNTKYVFYPAGREAEAKVFNEFIGYALRDVDLKMLDQRVLQRCNVTSAPKNVLETVWENLGDCIIDEKVDTSLMTNVVLNFLNDYAYRNSMINPYDMVSVTNIRKTREKKSREEAWGIMQRGAIFQKALMAGTALDTVLDSILEHHNITLAKANKDVVETIEDIDFMHKVEEEGEPARFEPLLDKRSLNNDLLSLRFAMTSLPMGFEVNRDNTTKPAESLSKSEPRIFDVVMNLDVVHVKKLVNPHAK